MNQEQQAVSAEVEPQRVWIKPLVRKMRAGGAEFSGGGGLDGSGLS